MLLPINGAIKIHFFMWRTFLIKLCQNISLCIFYEANATKTTIYFPLEEVQYLHNIHRITIYIFSLFLLNFFWVHDFIWCWKINNVPWFFPVILRFCLTESKFEEEIVLYTTRKILACVTCFRLFHVFEAVHINIWRQFSSTLMYRLLSCSWCLFIRNTVDKKIDSVVYFYIFNRKNG